MARIRDRIVDGVFSVDDGVTTVIGLAGVFGRIRKWRTVLQGAVDTADATCTLKVDGNAVSGGVITIATASSAQGDVDEALSCDAVVTPTSVLSVTVADGGTAVDALTQVEIDL